jgi:pSer/pThr/pTyr-binding forkhead associated (FHA) protein
MSNTVTIRQSSSSPPAGPERGFTLTVIAGPDQGRRFELDKAEVSRVLVGQSPACFVQLSDREVSRRHLAMEFAGGRLRLVDLESTNGTYVGGLSISAAFLVGGETIGLGRTSLRVEAATLPDSSVRAPTFNLGRFVGGSDAIRRIYPLCRKLADATIPVTIEGETGSG